MTNRAKKKDTDSHLFASNRKARRDYDVLESFETGIALMGTEIKSIRLRRVSIDDSFARIERGEVFLYNMHVSPYEQGNRFNADPLRVRKLLIHRREIERLDGLIRRDRVTLVPLRLYQTRGRAKIELAVARGKRQYEKRDAIQKRESDREIGRTLRARQKRDF
jgi:SsrA-binding protein